VNPLALKAAEGAALLALAFSAGWISNGWRLHTEIAEMKTTAATERADSAGTALANLTEAATIIRDQATRAGTDVTALKGQLATIQKEIKNANPLPADCKPDAQRVRRLAASAGAVDAAITRQRSGSAVPAAGPAGK
jgi:hypothetical protein